MPLSSAPRPRAVRIHDCPCCHATNGATIATIVLTGSLRCGCLPSCPSKATSGRKECRRNDGLGQVPLAFLNFRPSPPSNPGQLVDSTRSRFVGASGPCHTAVVCPWSLAALTHQNDATKRQLFFLLALSMPRRPHLHRAQRSTDKLVGCCPAP